MLSKEAINEFREIFEREYGRKISLEEAERQGEELLRLYKMVYRKVQFTTIQEGEDGLGKR